MNTANMPNYLSNLQRQGVSPSERSRMAQILGNCAQPLTHRGGMNVSGGSHFINNGDVYSGGSTANYKGGDITTNNNDGTSINNNFVDNTTTQDFYDQRTITNDFSQKTWNTHEYGDIINNLEMYQQNYENIYNEGNVENHYNDNRIWDMRDFSQTTTNTFHQHVQEGDTFSFPTTNEFNENNFFNGPTIINEGDVINKRLVINEGDTIINEGDTTITYEGDSYESHFHAGDINNTYNTRNTYVSNNYRTTENHFHQQVNQYINEYIYSPQFITNIIQVLGGPLVPFRQVGPFVNCGAFKVNTTATSLVQVPNYTFNPSHTLQIGGSIDCVDGQIVPNLTITGDIDVGESQTTAPQIIHVPISANVKTPGCSTISGLGLTKNQAPSP